MVKGIVLVKCNAQFRDRILLRFLEVKRDRTFSEKHFAVVDEVLLAFGWPDLIVTLWSQNVNTLKDAVVTLRELALKSIGNPNAALETSTIICMRQRELNATKLVYSGKISDPIAHVDFKLMSKLPFAEFAANEATDAQDTARELDAEGKKMFAEYSKMIRDIERLSKPIRSSRS